MISVMTRRSIRNIPTIIKIIFSRRVNLNLLMYRDPFADRDTASSPTDRWDCLMDSVMLRY